MSDKMHINIQADENGIRFTGENLQPGVSVTTLADGTGIVTYDPWEALTPDEQRVLIQAARRHLKLKQHTFVVDFKEICAVLEKKGLMASMHIGSYLYYYPTFEAGYIMPRGIVENTDD